MPINLLQLVKDVALVRPDATAIDDGKQALTYAQLEHLAQDTKRRLSAALSDATCVGLAIDEPIPFVVLRCALPEVDRTIVQASAGRDVEINEWFSQAGCDAIIFCRAGDRTPASAEKETEPPDGFSWLDLEDIGPAIGSDFEVRIARSLSTPAGGSVPPESPVGNGAPKVVMPTSGTTGRPKAVEHRESSICAVADQLANTLGLRPEDKLLHHMDIRRGAGFFLWAGILVGATNLVMPEITSRDLPAALGATRASGTFAVSAGLHQLSVQGADAATLPEFRTLYYSSGPVTTSLKSSLATAFPGTLVQDYGLTEVPESLAVLDRRDHLVGLKDPERMASVGRTKNAKRLKIVTPDGHEAKPCEEGQIEIQSPDMFLGYRQSGVLSRAQFSNGWFRAADRGHIDEHGFLHLCGRSDGVIRSGGESISLAEVQAALRAIPGVQGASVVAVEDDRLGQMLSASIELGSSDDRSSEQIASELRGKLDRKAIPKTWKVTRSD